MANPLKKMTDFLGFPGGGLDLPSAPAAPVAPRSVGSVTRNLTPLRGSRRAGDISEIVTFQPADWAESAVIAATFREGTPVIVNMADMAPLDQRRLLDFMLGLQAGLEGNLKRVTKTVFLLSPTHVVVNEEDEPEVTGMDAEDDLDIRRP
ncbi:MAG: cell division protein SepF [Micrococcales bacterium]